MSLQPEISLNSLFDEGYKLFESFDKRDDPTNSPEFQVSSIKVVALCIYSQIIKKRFIFNFIKT